MTKELAENLHIDLDIFQRFVENTKKVSALNAEDIAEVILFAVNAPSYVNINELMIRPTTQEI